MEKKVKKYTIGGVEYVQSELVLGQLKQLSPILEKIAPEGKLRQEAAIEDVIDMAAVILLKEGEAPADKKLNEVKKVIEQHVTMSLVTEILQDFFTLNSGLEPPPPKKEETTEKKSEEQKK